MNTTHVWQQEPLIRRVATPNNVALDTIIAFAVRDDGLVCDEREILDDFEFDTGDGEQDDAPANARLEEIKIRLLSRLEKHLVASE